MMTISITTPARKSRTQKMHASSETQIRAAAGPATATAAPQARPKATNPAMATPRRRPGEAAQRAKPSEK